MKYRLLGKTGLKVSELCLGTLTFGTEWGLGTKKENARKIWNTYIEAGGNFIDTAQAYGDGRSERIVDEVLRGIDREIYVASKLPPRRGRWGPPSWTPLDELFPTDHVLEGVEFSLRNLGVERLDIYQLHTWCETWNTADELFMTIDKLKDQGKIRSIGVSNFSRPQLQEAQQYGRIDSLQPPYSLFWRHVEKDLMLYCIESKITILAYSPMAQGFLTGKFGPEHIFEKGDVRAKNKLFQPEMYDRVQQALSRLEPIARQKGITLGQLALGWVISRAGTCAIAGARNADQATGNAMAGTIALSEQELVEIDEIGRAVTDYLDDDPVMWNF